MGQVSSGAFPSKESGVSQKVNCITLGTLWPGVHSGYRPVVHFGRTINVLFPEDKAAICGFKQRQCGPALAS